MELKLRKNIKVLALIMGMILSSTVFTFASERNGIVIASEGIVRKASNFSGEVIKTASIGTKVSVLETVGEWHRVKLEDEKVEGWMFKDIVALDKMNDKVQKGITTASVLNVRSQPSTSGSIVAKLSEGTEVTIIDSRNEWYQINIQQAANAWVHGDFVRLIPNHPQGVITKNDVSLRENKSTSSKTITTFKKDEKIFIKNYQEGWYLIVTDKFVEGWVMEDEAELSINVTRPVSRSGERADIFNNVAEITKKYLGKKYGWGQAGPDRFDCSGFAYYILNNYYGEYLKAKSITLPRSSRDQATVGTNVNKSDLKLGDLVFFNTDAKIGKTITHVGIYIGDGEFIHASSARQAVMISSLDEGYYNTRYIKAIRL